MTPTATMITDPNLRSALDALPYTAGVGEIAQVLIEHGQDGGTGDVSVADAVRFVRAGVDQRPPPVHTASLANAGRHAIARSNIKRRTRRMLSKKTRRALAGHHCCECNAEINPGRAGRKCADCRKVETRERALQKLTAEEREALGV